MSLTDTVVTGIPLGYTFGRLGNFLNAELYGRVTEVPWGMVFPTAPGFSTTHEWVRTVADDIGMPYSIGDVINLPRHPSQLYEALFEGVVLFLILWFIVRPIKKKKAMPDGFVFSFYLMGYGLFRFFIEYCRQPDEGIGYIIALGRESNNIALFQSFLNISEGQIFCFIMVAAGALLLSFLLIRRQKIGDYNRGKGGKPQGKAKGRKA